MVSTEIERNREKGKRQRERDGGGGRKIEKECVREMLRREPPRERRIGVGDWGRYAQRG